MQNYVDSELLLKTVEESPASIVITDVRGNIEYVNNKFSEVTGYSKKEVLGKNPRILKSDKQDDQYYKEMWKTISSGKEWRGEFCNKRKNGEEFWEIVSISSFKNENNEIIKYVAVKEDITERKNMEKILKMRNFSMETAKDGMMWLDSNGKITYANQSYCEMLNCNTNNFLKKNLTWFDIVPKDSKSLWNEYWSILKKKKCLTVEHYHCVKKIIFPIETSLNYFTLDNTEIVFVFTRNITERKNMENKLKLSEEKFSKAFMFSPDAIIISELETSKYIDVNEAFELLSGWKRDECIGKTIYELNIWKYPEKRIEIIELLNKNSGLFYNYELELILKNGEERTGLMAGRIINYDGKDRLLTITKDISDRKKYELELKEAKEKAEVSDKLKSSFLANMSHEIRTPMNSIIGFSDLLKDEYLSQEEKLSYIKIINESSNDLLSLIDEIIDIAKIESGQLKLDVSEYYIENILSDVYNTYKSHVKNNVKFICENINDDTKVLVKTDAYRIKQILTNLITNAIKFTEKGYIEFGYHIKNDKIEFFVKDTGLGIEEKNFKMIFERFRQVDDSPTRKFGGTGLGLNICSNLVKLLNGEIWLESKINEGSIFYFNVPFIPSEDYKNQIIKAIDTDYNWKNKKILVAEDVKPNFIFIQEVLKRTNAEIYWAIDGQETVDMYKKIKPDIVLMDLQMPKLNGFEAREKIMKLNKKAVVIAQTAYAMLGDKTRCLDEGFNDYIPKPINKHLLLSKIDLHIKK
jgi:PAS domain S-box-containing protein